MTQFSKVTSKTKFSEHRTYSVVKVVGNEVELKTDGESIVVPKEYVEKFLISSDQYAKEEKLSRTEIANIFISNANTVFTVSFQKQVKEADVLKEIVDAHENSTPKDFAAKAKKAVKSALDGVERTLIGIHSGNQDEFGRINVTDLEIETGHNLRLVDPRTINYLIIKGVKYIVK